MTCLFPGTIKSSKTDVWSSFRCGRCVGCRVTKRSQWTLRHRLESREAVSSAFWTLTFSEENISAWDATSPRTTTRRFMDALRKSEVRRGNMLPIRCFGVTEFGGLFGRPHTHLLIYNMVHNLREPVTYLKGLPRPRISIPIWPHGHVDVAEYNPKTINYVLEYLHKDSRESPVYPIYAKNPAIGYSGIVRLAESLAKQHGSLPRPPTSFDLGGSPYPLDRYTREKFAAAFRAAGGRYSDYGNPKSRWLVRLSVAEAYALDKNRDRRLFSKLTLYEGIDNGETEAIAQQELLDQAKLEKGAREIASTFFNNS